VGDCGRLARRVLGEGYGDAFGNLGGGQRRVATLERAGPRFESDLEGWVERDSSLLGDGLTIVGRQIRLHSGPLDLLAIDAQGRWVVIELKRERLRRHVLAQALDYATSIKAMDVAELRTALEPYLAQRGDPDLESLIDETISSEEPGVREVAIILAGLRADDQLERMSEFLAGHGVPVSILILSGFETADGSLLLVREVGEEGPAAAANAVTSTRDVESIIRRADEFGVGKQFRRFLDMVNTAGLYARPYTRAVMAAPQENRTRLLLVAKPLPGGRMALSHNPDGFAEWFPIVTVKEVEDALGPHRKRGERRFEGSDLDLELDRLSGFLSTLSERSRE
jgi:Holliday junction resolvase-like predicted endonuclease